jgi:hypothetical protein
MSKRPVESSNNESSCDTSRKPDPQNPDVKEFQPNQHLIFSTPEWTKTLKHIGIVSAIKTVFCTVFRENLVLYCVCVSNPNRKKCEHFDYLA